MAKRLYAFIKTFYNVTFALIGVPQILFFCFTRPIVMEMYKGSNLANLPAYACLATMVFSSYSFIRIEATYNQPLRESFWGKKVCPSVKSRLKFLVSQPEFWIKVFIIALIYLLLPLSWTLNALVAVTHAVGVADKLLCLALLLPTLFVLAVLAHLSVYKRWGVYTSPTAYSKKEYKKESIYAGIAYGAGVGVFVTSFPFLAPVFMFVLGLITVKRVVTVAVILCLIFVYSLLRTVLKRRSFLRRLKKMCKEKGYPLSEIQEPYISLFMFLKGESFNIRVGEKVYSCKLISARKRKVPIIISQHGELAFIHTVSIRGAVLHQRAKSYKLDYKSHSPKILIVNPVPKLVCEQRGDKVTEIDNGAMVGDYKFFAATGFLRAAELDVLDK